MYLRIIGASPGESAIILFDDGSVITIDCCARKGSNYTLMSLEELGIEYSAVKYSILTHFHDDHIRGAAELIGKCANTKVVIPDAWTKDVFLRYVATTSREASLKSASVTNEIERIFDLMGNQPERLFPVSELISLHPPASLMGPSHERLIVMTPRTARKSRFLTDLAVSISKGEADAFEFLISNKNSTSISCLLHANDGYVFLGGDVENLPPEYDIRQVHRDHLTEIAVYNLVKLPHHGSDTSFCDELRSRIDDAKTTVAITPYPRGHKRLPSKETQNYLSGAEKVFVLSGERTRLSRSQKDQRNKFFRLDPIRTYRPGILDFMDGDIDSQRCMGLKEYLAQI